MTRHLEYPTLDGAARHYAAEWMRPDRRTPSGKRWLGGQAYVLQDFHNFTFKDEYEYVLDGMRGWLGSRAIAEFEAAGKEHFSPRDDTVFAALLREKLAIDPNGNHIRGVIGTANIGTRIVGLRHKLVKTRHFGEILLPKNEYWPVYAGEPEERELGTSRPDELPKDAEPWPVDIVYANVTNISAELCIAALDRVTISLEEGSTAAEIRGRDGSQPADPDAAETGNLLFTLTMTDPNAFAGAVDDTDGSCSATAATITDDVSADFTATLGYCRFAATGTGLDDHIDGNATTDGTGATDWNTLAIVSGSTVSMTSCVMGMSQGPTAS